MWDRARVKNDVDFRWFWPNAEKSSAPSPPNAIQHWAWGGGSGASNLTVTTGIQTLTPQHLISPVPNVIVNCLGRQNRAQNCFDQHILPHENFIRIKSESKNAISRRNSGSSWSDEKCNYRPMVGSDLNLSIQIFVEFTDYDSLKNIRSQMAERRRRRRIFKDEVMWWCKLFPALAARFTHYSDLNLWFVSDKPISVSGFWSLVDKIGT